VLSNRTRIAAPFVVTGLIVAGAWVPTLRASASPDLPGITPAHLVEKALREKVSHLSGTFQWQADLGLPSLSGLTGSGQGVAGATGFDPTSLLSGTQTFKVWIDGANRQRIASPGSLSETDLVRNGDQAWLYDSATNHVTHYVPANEHLVPGENLIGRTPARIGFAGRGVGAAGNGMAGNGNSGGATGSDWSSAPGTDLGQVSVTQIADGFLSGLRAGGSTVTTGRPVEVAGHAAYLLRIAPNRTIAANRASTIADVTIAVDAKTGLPLRVSIYAAGQASPALQVGWSSVSYATPSASVFAAPVGGSTTTKTISPPSYTGWSGSAPLVRSSATVTLHQVAGSEQIDAQDQGVGTRWAEGPVTVPLQKTASSQPVVSKATLSTSTGSSRTVMASPSLGAGIAALGADWGSIRSIPMGNVAGGSAAGELASVTTVVSGSWGSGRLLKSSLVNVLFLDNGRVLIGAVTPAALEAAAGHIHR
jgi:outer membrane lipoprotein-sorting protein